MPDTAKRDVPTLDVLAGLARDAAGKLAASHPLDCAAWPIFFAVVRGHSLVNGCYHVRGERGYFFSVDIAATWRDGWVYLLPRREWLSPTAVRPIDRLRVTPADFPLLEKVVRHRQGEPLVRAVARATILRR